MSAKRRQRSRTPVAVATRWRDVMPCYISVQDRELRIIETNALFRQDFGDDKFGEHCYEVYKHRDSPCPDCPVLKTFEDGQDHTSEEVVVNKRGETAHVMVTSTPFSREVDRITARQDAVGELLEAVMVVSANDAAVALAEHVGGSVGEFVELMNERASELGLNDTSYANPHGLDAGGQYTSARDLLTLAREVMTHSTLASMALRQEALLVRGDGSTRRRESTNELLDRFPGAIGIKMAEKAREHDKVYKVTE